MRYLGGRFRNIGAFADFEFTLSPGVNGVVGPNGSGKSTFVDALYFALTGDFMAGGNKGTNIAASAKSTASSFVEARLETRAGLVEIVRSLRGPQSNVTLNGKNTVSGETAVKEKMAEILGTSPILAGEHSFVWQKDFAGFLDLTPTVRAAYFQRLLNIQKADKVYAMLNAVLSKEPPLQRPEGIDSYAADKAAAREERDRLGREVEESAKGLKRGRKSDRRTVADYKQLVAGRKGLAAAKTARTEGRDLIAHLKVMLKKARKAEAEWLSLLATAEAWDAYNESKAAAKRATAALAALTKPEEPVEPVEPPGYSEITAARRQDRDDKKRNYDADRDLIAEWDGTGKAKCPTCGTPASTIVAVVERLKKGLPALKRAYEEAEAALVRDRRYEADREAYGKASRIYARAWAGYVADRDARVAEVERCGANVVDKPDGEEPIKSVVTLQKEVRRASGVVAEREASLRAAEKAMPGLEAAVKARVAAIAEAKKALAALGGTPKSAYRQARASLAAARKIQADHNQLVGRHDKAKEEYSRLKEKHADLVAQDRAAGPAREWRAVREAAKSILGPKGAPMILTADSLDLVAEVTNEMLEAGRQPFTVTVKDDLTFIAHFPDSRGSQPATRLSGAQQTNLALAIRFGVHLRFAAESGFLAADEPTAFLDAENVLNLVPMLEAFRAKATGAGIQCVIVTHAEQLTSTFDHTIRIARP